MIADLDETIRQLLISEIPIKNGEIDIAFEQPKREWSARLNRPTINLFLYDLRENINLRQHQWETAATNGVTVNRKRAPYRLDCFYMMTCWASEPEDEHRLMSRSVLAMLRHPVLPRDYLTGYLVDQPFEIAPQMVRHDRLTNPAELWGALDNEIRPGVSYIITLAFDPWTLTTDPVVNTLTMRTNLGKLPDQNPVKLQPAQIDIEKVIIAGTIRTGNRPRPGIQVALRGTGYMDTTNLQGRFRLGAVVPGHYSLLAWLPDDGSRPVEKRISVPATNGNYDLQIE